MIPDTWVPTSTFVTGSTVPVAVTELEMSILSVLAVSRVTVCFPVGRKISQSAAAVQMMPTAIHKVLVFILIDFIISLVNVE